MRAGFDAAGEAEWHRLVQSPRNLVSFASLLMNKEGALAPDYEDEILKAAIITRDGQVVHPSLS